TSSCSIAVECQTGRILKRSKRTQAFARGKQIDFGCQVNIHVKRRSKGIQCSLDIHTDSEMENKIDTFDEPSEQPSTSLMSERKFIVFEEQLLSLFLTCHYCHGPAK
ncbi:hypothetical protein ACJMK2_018690, partial [Sinanodonta woodiana]